MNFTAQQSVLNFIASHKAPRRNLRIVGNLIKCEEEVQMIATGAMKWVEISIPATMRAAREHLGY